MAAILRKAWEGYVLLFDELPDPRTKNWPFVAKPWQAILLLTLYLMFVLKWGPQFMKNRQPYKLDKIIMVYNLFQVVACSHIFFESVWYAWGWKYKWVCEPVDFSNSELGLKATSIVYRYYLTKLLDLMDTVFFILRKKFNQVSFLHVYHHFGMVMLIWGAITYYPGGHGTFVGVINSFVHVIMYFYYFLTIAMPSVRKSLWWKKYITQLQIFQFFWCVVHMSFLVFTPDCGYPRWVAAIFLPQNLFMLLLFIDFYIKTYIRKPQEIKKNDDDKYKSNGNSNNSSNNNEKGKTKTILNEELKNGNHTNDKLKSH